MNYLPRKFPEKNGNFENVNVNVLINVNVVLQGPFTLRAYFFRNKMQP